MMLHGLSPLVVMPVTHSNWQNPANMSMCLHLLGKVKRKQETAPTAWWIKLPCLSNSNHGKQGAKSVCAKSACTINYHLPDNTEIVPIIFIHLVSFWFGLVFDCSDIFHASIKYDSNERLCIKLELSYMLYATLRQGSFMSKSYTESILYLQNVFI